MKKITDRAEEIVAIHRATKNWNEIKNSLILNHGDQRDENSLNQDLVNLRQNHNKTAQIIKMQNYSTIEENFLLSYGQLNILDHIFSVENLKSLLIMNLFNE